MRYIKYLAIAVFFVCFQLDVLAQVWWGYSDNTISKGVGLGQNTEVSGAIYIPAEVAELYKGKKITAVRVGLNNSVSALTIFIKENLNKPSQTEASFGSQKAGILSFNFENEYVLDGKGFYVGYTCTGINAIGHSNVYNPNGCWLKEGDGEWVDCAGDESYKYNALNIFACIEGDDMPLEARLIVDNETRVKPNEDFSISVKIENLSRTAIKKYQIKYAMDNGEETVVDKSTYLAAGSTAKISFDFPAFADNGTHTAKFSLLQVNGETDAYAGNNDVVTNVRVTDASFVKRMVVEEGTGTWCGWCPRGIVAFEQMQEKYPDTFIGIAVHVDDLFEENTYLPIQSYFTGYPRCIVNRDPARVYDPAYSNLESAYKSVCNEAAVANVYVSAYIDGNDIYAKVTTTFAASDKGLNYRIAFVILEDSITGYEQNNNYSGGSNGAMGGFEDLPRYASINFNHVARGIYDYNGIEGSVPSDVEEGEFYDFEKVIPLPVVQKTDYLSIVALFINGKTGLIDNAAKSRIQIGKGVGSTQQVDIAIWADEYGNVLCSEKDGKIEVFNLDGMSMPAQGLDKGIYIVRYTSPDGNSVVRKIAF